MSRRAATLTAIAFVLLAGAALPATAAVVDPELSAALAAKAAGERVDVLLLMDDAVDAAELERLVAGGTPQARRAAVVLALREHARASQQAVRRELDAAVAAGHADQGRVLWLANGIAFRGAATAVAALAAEKSAATMLLDKPYKMAGAAKAGAGASRGAAGNRASSVSATVTGAAVADTAWGVKWIKANRVWLDTGFMGNGVVVEHLDTGVWLTHPDIAGRLWTNPGEIAGNGIDDDQNGYVDDVHGYDFANHDSDPNDDVLGDGANHGTHTAGTVAGDGTLGTVTGVAPRAQIMVCKVYLSNGTGAQFSAIYEGEQYGLDMGARVMTMSLGVGGALPIALQRNERRVGDLIRLADVALFNAAGNDHGTFTVAPPPDELGVTARVPSPWIAGAPWSARSGVVAVGGTGYKSNSNYASSSRGPAQWGDVPPYNDWPYPPGLTKPDVSAPAVNVNSLLKPSGYSGDTWSGTSMATPHAAGTAALLLSKNPSLSPAGIDSILEQTAIDLGDPGKDNTYGAGEIDALAAIHATPAALLPYLVLVDTSVLDAGGDGIIDPGETVDLVLTVANTDPAVDATGVTGGLTVAPNPWVTVTAGSATYPDIPRGSAATNGAQHFTFSVAPGTPQGFVFTLRLTIGAAGGYQQTEDFKLFAGLPDLRDHDVGDVVLTVTDRGSIGYLDDSQSLGSGFAPKGLLGSYLFIGSLWGGTDPAYVCNRDYSGTSGTPERYEWVTTHAPNGRVAVVASETGEQQFQAIFADSGAVAPRGVVVSQRSIARAGSDFVTLRYRIENTGNSALNDYYCGIFADFDVSVDSQQDFGGTDASRHVSYINAPGGPYCGVALLSPPALRNLSLIDNPTYVYPRGMVTDANKIDLLKGTLSNPGTTTSSDYSLLTSAGPITIAAGQAVTVAFAMIYGGDLASLQASADAAIAQYRASAPVELAQFTAERDTTTGAIVHWTLSQPEPTVAFHVWRRPAGQTLMRLTSEPLTGLTEYTFIDPDPPAVSTEYWLQETIAGGAEGWDGPALLSGGQPPGLIFALAQNKPNPFNPGTLIPFTVERQGLVEIDIFDAAGRHVRKLVHADYAPGQQTATWDGRDDRGAKAPAGLYLYRYRSGGGTLTRKMMLVR